MVVSAPEYRFPYYRNHGFLVQEYSYAEKLQEKRFDFIKNPASIIPENVVKVSKIKCFKPNQQTLNKRNKAYFDKLIKYLTDQGIEIEFFLCPLCPTLWDRLAIGITDCQYYILDEIESHVREIAGKYNIKVTGSYNPYTVGISDEDFWDSRHIRDDRLDIFFDFTD